MSILVVVKGYCGPFEMGSRGATTAIRDHFVFPWVWFEAHGPLWGLLGWLSVWALVVGPELVPLDGLWKGF